MITVKDAGVCKEHISGDCLRTGRAYRLAASETGRGFIGNIYIKGVNDIVSLSNPGSARNPSVSDKYVEVDLEITVKEKT